MQRGAFSAPRIGLHNGISWVRAGQYAWVLGHALVAL